MLGRDARRRAARRRPSRPSKGKGSSAATLDRDARRRAARRPASRPSNGKGSTAAMRDAVLRAAGRRTGLYTSPHLVDFTERIRVDGRTIPRATVVDAVRELRADLDAAGI